jgi:NRPS condensation-like uncharacterized protein
MKKNRKIKKTYFLTTIVRRLHYDKYLTHTVFDSKAHGELFLLFCELQDQLLGHPEGCCEFQDKNQLPQR